MDVRKQPRSTAVDDDGRATASCARFHELLDRYSLAQDDFLQAFDPVLNKFQGLAAGHSGTAPSSAELDRLAQARELKSDVECELQAYVAAHCGGRASRPPPVR